MENCGSGMEVTKKMGENVVGSSSEKTAKVGWKSL